MTSVVICTYNRSEFLSEALSSLARMHVPAGMSWEVIVVDNNSTDDTRAMVERFAQASTFKIRYIFERNQGLSYARNAGVKAAKGEIVSFIDDDVTVTPDWMTEVARAFLEFNPVCVGGRVLIKGKYPKPKWWSPICEGALGGFDKGDSVIIGDGNHRGSVAIGANLSFKRSVFEESGFFRTDLGRKGKQLLQGEETEFINRLRAKVQLTVYYPRALVYTHPHQERATKRYLRRWYYGMGKYHASIETLAPDAVTWFGIPRTEFRSLIEEIAKWTLTFKSGRRFCRELEACRLVGRISAWRQTDHQQEMENA